MSTSRKSQIFLVIGGVAIVFLLSGCIYAGLADSPFPAAPTRWCSTRCPCSWWRRWSCFYLSWLVRLVRLGAERLAKKPGSRFKTKMVLGAIAVSFLPVIVLFFVSYALLESHACAVVSPPAGNCHGIQPLTGERNEPRRFRAHVGDRQGSCDRHRRRTRREMPCMPSIRLSPVERTWPGR